jgi:glucosamine 6-phosphate synthetase-like amidotransferase/phosphosugar isomerase protein
MCGIFAIITDKNINLNDAKILANHTRQRGKDSSGFLSYDNRKYFVDKFDFDLKKSIKKINLKNKKLIIGHSRLVTNSMNDNQPIYDNNICVFHNGIVTNYEKLFKKFNLKQKLEIDTEIINSLFDYALKKKNDLVSVVEFIKKEIEGSASCVIALPEIGKVVLFSNNGSLYFGKKDGAIYISSEKYPLTKTNCSQINQVTSTEIFDIPKQLENKLIINDFKIKRKNLVPIINTNFLYKKYLNYNFKKKDRCTKCILPNTFPFIRFDEKGVCNYCNNYKKKKFRRKKG